MSLNCAYSGKVRDVYDLTDDYLMMEATDKISAFDKHIGIVPGKGELLNKMSKYWFNNTEHIINNHLLFTDNNMAFVKKCTPILIEIVVRGYITGNTSTSLLRRFSNRKSFANIPQNL